MNGYTLPGGCGEQAAMTCVEQLQDLYRAYMELISGAQIAMTQSADFRRVEFTKANINDLISHYNMLWDQCGAASGLPRLESSRSGARRGGPAIVGC